MNMYAFIVKVTCHNVIKHKVTEGLKVEVKVTASGHCIGIHCHLLFLKEFCKRILKQSGVRWILKVC